MFNTRSWNWTYNYERQIYGECAALGRKLVSLAAEYHLTHIAATLQGLIQQVEQANSTESTQDDIIQNPLQSNTKRRPAKWLKSSTEENKSKGLIHVAIVSMMVIMQEDVKHHVKFVKKTGTLIYIVKTKKIFNFLLLLWLYNLFFSYTVYSCNNN